MTMQRVKSQLDPACRHNENRFVNFIEQRFFFHIQLELMKFLWNTINPIDRPCPDWLQAIERFNSFSASVNGFFEDLPKPSSIFRLGNAQGRRGTRITLFAGSRV